MKNKILLLLMIFGLCYCTSPKYFARSQSEIIKLDLDKSITNYIPLADDDLNKSKILELTYNLIINKKYSKLDRYINSLEKKGISSSDLFLSKTILLITQNDYSAAIQSLRKINDSDYL